MPPPISTRSLALGAVAAALAILLGAGMAMRQAYFDQLSFQARETVNFAVAVERDMSRLFTAADRALQQAANDIAPLVAAATPDATRLHAYLRDRKRPVAEARAMFYYDAAGRLVANSLASRSPQAAGPPAYVHRFIDHPSPDTYIGASVEGPVTGQPLIPVTRSLIGAGGRLIGVLGLALEPTALADYYASLDLDAGTRVEISRDDGGILVAWPASSPTRPAAPTIAPQSCTAAGRPAASRTDDGRTYAACHVTGWPVKVTVSADRGAALARWRAIAANQALVAGVALACVAALFAALFKLAHRHDTERRQREAAQQSAARSQARYSRMFDLLPEIVTVTDLETGRYIDVNGAWSAVLGHTRADTLGRTSTELAIWVDPEEREQLVRALEHSPEVRNRRARFRAKDGHIVDAVFSGMVTESEGARLLTLITRDVSAELEIAHEVEESRAFLHAIFDVAPVGIVVTAVDVDEVMHFNEAAAGMYGLPGPAERYIGQSGAAYGFWKSEEHRRAAFAPVLASPAGLTFEHVLVAADGVRRWVRTSAIRATMRGRDCVVAIMQDATERRAADLALRDSNERFSRVFQSTPAPTVIIDLAGQTYADVNHAWVQFTGHRREEVVGHPVAETRTIVDPEQRERLFGAVMAGASIRAVPARYRKKDGTIAEVLASLELLHTGEQALLVASFVDVTDLHAAEAEVRRRDRETLALINSIPIALASVDRDRVCRSCNLEYALMYGKRPEELVGMALADIAGTAYVATRPMLDRVQMGERVRYERAHDRLAGHTIEVVLVPKTDESGANDGWFAAIMDITERKAAEARLGAERERLARLFDLIPEPVVAFDVHRMAYTAVNRSWETTFGHFRNASEGQSPTDLGIWLSAAQRDEILALHRSPEAFVTARETAFRSRDGGIVECELSTTPEIDIEGQRTRIAVMRDVSAQRRAEREVRKLNAELELRVAQRTAALVAANEELQSFTYTVSHDLRAPLRSIVGFAQILNDEYADDLDDEARRMLGLVTAGAIRMAELIDALLALSRLSRNELVRSRVDLSALARLIVAELRQAEPAREVDVIIEDGLIVNADPGMSKSLMQNLLGNAWKYSGRVPRALIEVGTSKAGVEFFVRDNGAGFDMRYAHRLFEVFQRMHRAQDFEGLGVGLATVKRIVERHGGTIRADSTPGEGATFYFTLG